MKNLLIPFFALLILVSCKKNDKLVNKVKKSENVAEKIAAEKEFGTALLQAYKEMPVIKTAAVNECLKLEQGDYTVRIEKLIEIAKQTPGAVPSLVEKLQTGFEKLKLAAPGRIPQVFIPSVENIDPRIKRPSQDVPTDAPGVPVDVVVFEDVPPGSGDSYPGYILGDNNNIVYSGMVNETYAWDNDVSVIGYEEVCSPENSFAHPADTVYNPVSYFDPNNPPSTPRIDGRQEWGGIIQVTDLNAIEPWTQGKFEFKYYVNSSTGTVLKARDFGKWRRKNFKEEKWVNFQDNIGFWNQSNWGPMHLERWTEMDDQFGIKTTISTNLNPGQGFPSTTITHTFDADDDDLGVANVQFTDPAGPSDPITTYTISYMNFRRITTQ